MQHGFVCDEIKYIDCLLHCNKPVALLEHKFTPMRLFVFHRACGPLILESAKMECTVSWTGNTGARSAMGFVAETGTGHVLMMDGAPDAAKPENGGQNLAVLHGVARRLRLSIG